MLIMNSPNKIPSFQDLCSLSPEQLREKYPHLFSNSFPSQLEYPTQVEENGFEPVVLQPEPDYDEIYDRYREMRLGQYGY